MRLETDASNNSKSASHTHSNGSGMRSPGGTAVLGKDANGSSNNEETNGSASAYTNGNSTGKRRTETFFGHDREELTRILIQSLTDLGYQNAAGSLINESGFELESSTVAAFRSAVLAGEWAEAEALLFGVQDDGSDLYDAPPSYGKSRGKAAKSTWSPRRHTRGLTLAEGADPNEMKFWMRQQKYLELLEQRDIGAALMVLRQELTPLHQDVSRLHNLSSLMMCDSAQDLKQHAQWDGASGESRKHLLSELSKAISPSVMIPEHRLAVLLDTIKNNWVSDCLYHNTSASPSLYVDHICDPDDFPRKLDRELSDHHDEVWYLQYSPDGTKLATAGKDRAVLIYDTSTYRVDRTLVHDGAICYLAWSPDNTKLITCTHEQGQDTSARLWDVANSHVLFEMEDFTYPVMSAAWAPDGETYVTGSQDTRQSLIVWDIRKKDRVHQWPEEEQLRVDDLAISPDGQRLVVATNGTAGRIFIYDYNTRDKIRDLVFDGVRLTSIVISHDSKTLLVSISNNKTKLIDLNTGDTIRTFIGHKQESFVVRSSFGGASETFVVSGSENNRIYIWRTSGSLVETIEAHRGCVNAISWHPKNPLVFASAGDDGKVKIWTTSGHSSISGPSSNGAHL